MVNDITPRPMSEAPTDGTFILAWWPPTSDTDDNGGWITTWMGRARNGIGKGWENPWEWERPESGYAPTHWLPHPQIPEVAK